MPFAIELYFNRATESAVRSIWDDLAVAGISDRMPASGARPHVSLAVYQERDVSSDSAVLSRFVQPTRPFDFTLASVGICPTTQGVVFLAPVLTRDLLDLHDRFHKQFARSAESCWPYYLPGNWVPHCTVAIDLAPELLPSAVEVCQRVVRPIRGTFEQVGLVAFPPVTEVVTFELSQRDGIRGGDT
jgi:2'-5' RNA ligase